MARFSAELSECCGRTAAPLRERQQALGDRMVALEGLCAHALYLLAARSSEVSSCAATLQQLEPIHSRLDETAALLARLRAKVRPARFFCAIGALFLCGEGAREGRRGDAVVRLRT